MSVIVGCAVFVGLGRGVRVKVGRGLGVGVRLAMEMAVRVARARLVAVGVIVTKRLGVSVACGVREVGTGVRLGINVSVGT